MVCAGMRIDVWSDVVCPWCYIGKRRLEKAIADGGFGSQVEVVWHSFQLDPSARNDDPRDLAERLGAKYGGGREFGLKANAQVTEVAAGDGLEFHFEHAKAANTVDAHRLLHLALHLVEAGELPADGQDRLKERLLRAYFTEGEAVGDHATLTRIAVEAGLPEARVAEVLAGREYADEVEADQAQAVAYGANGVPFFVIDEKYGVSGAQPVEVFDEVIRKALAERSPIKIVADGTSEGADGACGPDGCPI